MQEKKESPKNLNLQKNQQNINKEKDKIVIDFITKLIILYKSKNEKCLFKIVQNLKLSEIDFIKILIKK